MYLNRKYLALVIKLRLTKQKLSCVNFSIHAPKLPKSNFVSWSVSDNILIQLGNRRLVKLKSTPLERHELDPVVAVNSSGDYFLFTVLQLRLQQRRTREQLVDQGIMPRKTMLFSSLVYSDKMGMPEENLYPTHTSVT